MTQDDDADPDSPQNSNDPADDDATLSAHASAFVEEFALTWEKGSQPRIDGRVVGLLMIIDKPYLSSAQLGSLLKASAGAISTSTRRLVDVGFLKRHVIPGDRSHYFRVEDDIWGSFLAGERAYLRSMAGVIDHGLATIAGEQPGPHRRLVNARNYMNWLAGYHRKMLADWQAYRDEMTSGDEPQP